MFVAAFSNCPLLGVVTITFTIWVLHTMPLLGGGDSAVSIVTGSYLWTCTKGGSMLCINTLSKKNLKPASIAMSFKCQGVPIKLEGWGAYLSPAIKPKLRGYNICCTCFFLNQWAYKPNFRRNKFSLSPISSFHCGFFIAITQQSTILTSTNSCCPWRWCAQVVAYQCCSCCHIVESLVRESPGSWQQWWQRIVATWTTAALLPLLWGLLSAAATWRMWSSCTLDFTLYDFHYRTRGIWPFFP
jgi:hypothetical protein